MEFKYFDLKVLDINNKNFEVNIKNNKLYKISLLFKFRHQYEYLIWLNNRYSFVYIRFFEGKVLVSFDSQKDTIDDTIAIYLINLSYVYRVKPDDEVNKNLAYSHPIYVIDNEFSSFNLDSSVEALESSFSIFLSKLITNELLFLHNGNEIVMVLRYLLGKSYKYFGNKFDVKKTIKSSLCLLGIFNSLILNKVYSSFEQFDEIEESNHFESLIGLKDLIGNELDTLGFYDYDKFDKYINSNDNLRLCDYTFACLLNFRFAYYNGFQIVEEAISKFKIDDPYFVLFYGNNLNANAQFFYFYHLWDSVTKEALEEVIYECALYTQNLHFAFFLYFQVLKQNSNNLKINKARERLKEILLKNKTQYNFLLTTEKAPSFSYLSTFLLEESPSIANFIQIRFPEIYIEYLKKIITKGLSRKNKSDVLKILVYRLYKDGRIQYELFLKDNPALQEYISSNGLDIYLKISDLKAKNKLGDNGVYSF